MHTDSYINNCPLEYNANTRKWFCPICKEPTSPKHLCNRQLCRQPTHRNCRPETPEEKAERERQHAEDIDAGIKLGWTAADAKHWVQALRKWRKAGKPKRTDGEVLSIVEICQTCDEYREDEQRCAKCRCCISKKGMAVFNKARLKTESCPLGKW